MTGDARFLVERIVGGRVVGTVHGVTYDRATGFYAPHGMAAGDDVVRVRGFLATGEMAGADSPVVYELKRECPCGCGGVHDRCLEAEWLEASGHPSYWRQP